MMEAMVVIYYMYSTLLLQMCCTCIYNIYDTYIRLNNPNGGQLFTTYVKNALLGFFLLFLFKLFLTVYQSMIYKHFGKAK